MKVILPGQLLSKVSVFDLKVGDKVYDKATGKTGSVTSVRETSYECVEGFVTLEGEKSEVPVYKIPDYIYLGR